MSDERPPLPVIPEELWDNACTFMDMFRRAVALGQEMQREATRKAAEAEAPEEQASPITSVTEAAA